MVRPTTTISVSVVALLLVGILVFLMFRKPWQRYTFGALGISIAHPADWRAEPSFTPGGEPRLFLNAPFQHPKAKPHLTMRTVHMISFENIEENIKQRPVVGPAALASLRRIRIGPYEGAEYVLATTPEEPPHEYIVIFHQQLSAGFEAITYLPSIEIQNFYGVIPQSFVRRIAATMKFLQ